MRPTVTAAASDRGWGSCPTTVPLAAAAPAVKGKDCTVATVVWAPPPKTRTRPPNTAPAASWVGVAMEPDAAWVPPGTASVDTAAVDVLPDVRPPTTRS